MAPAAALPPRAVPRHGPRHWLDGYLAMLRWHFLSLRLWAPAAAAIEVLAGVGMVYAIGLLIPHITTRAAVYGTTGSAVITMLLLGLILGPQLVAEQKMNGTYEFLLTMPVPRSAAALAWYTVTLVIGLPAAAATLAAGILRYGITLSPAPQLTIAVLLSVFTATMLGYAVANAVSQPMVTIILAEVFIFLAFGYAPINFPSTQMPAWLVGINRGLPFLPMATTVRDGLTHGVVGDVGISYAVLCCWAMGSVLLALLALGRRR
jgi:ABC-2 type transport system permease protein